MNIERQAMKASISNTGEILNAGKWICQIYTEVVVDKEDFELEAILFKTTGCDINLKDFLVAKQIYYQEVIEKAGFNGKTKIKSQAICLKIADYLNSVIEEKGLEDSNLIKIDDILNVNLEEKDLPDVKYIPEMAWGNAEVKDETKAILSVFYKEYWSEKN